MKKFLISFAIMMILLAGNAYAAESYAVEVLNLVNAERARVGAPPLRLADDLPIMRRESPLFMGRKRRF